MKTSRLPGFSAEQAVRITRSVYTLPQGNGKLLGTSNVIPQQLPRLECNNGFLNWICQAWSLPTHLLCQTFAWAGDLNGYDGCMKVLVGIHAPWCAWCSYWWVP